jgi:RND family efflux transporter MFP subunit
MRILKLWSVLCLCGLLTSFIFGEEYIVTPLDREALLLAYGRVESLRSSRVAAEVPGRVLSRFIELGDSVKKDQILFHLEPGGLEFEIQALKWEIRENEISRDHHQKRLKRRTQNPKAYTEEAIDSERYTLDRLIASAGRLEARKKEQARKLSLKKIRAPYDGIVSGVFHQEGEWVGAGHKVCELLSLEGTRLHLEVSRRFFESVETGDTLQVLVAQKEIDGVVEQKVPSVNPGTGNHPLRVRLPLTIKDLSQGQILPVKIPYHEKVLRIPEDYVKQTGKSFHVVVFEKPGLTEVAVDGELEGPFFIPFDKALEGKVLQQIPR